MTDTLQGQFQSANVMQYEISWVENGCSVLPSCLNEYSVTHLGDVSSWLMRNPDLLPVLAEAPIQAQNLLKPGYRLELRMMESPEDSEGELVATVSIPGSAEAAHAQFAIFEEGWWMQRAMGCWGRLTFLLGFQD